MSCIINTHGHVDHSNGNEEAFKATKAPLLVYPIMKDGEHIPLGSLRLTVNHMPGHSADHIVIYEETQGLLFTGDLLFVGMVGGTKTRDDDRLEWDSLRRLSTLFPDTVTVWPGHDYGFRPSSTLRLEMASNPFLRCESFKDFVGVKNRWTHAIRAD